MRLTRLCSCGRDAAAGRTRCPDCTRLDNQRRAARNVKRGTNTRRWRKLRAYAIQRDGGCVRCGTTHDLTVHLDAALAGDHRQATSADVVTLCRSCHGSIDAPRASQPRFFKHGHVATSARTSSPPGSRRERRAQPTEKVRANPTAAPT